MATVVGVPKEIKDKENRVSVLPDGVAELAHHDHSVVVQADAGSGCGFTERNTPPPAPSWWAPRTRCSGRPI